MIKTFSLFVAMGVLSFSSLVAQHDTKEDTSRTPKYSIEEIVVTADRMENKIFSTTSSVAVLRSEEIRSLAAARFADALITIPGFFVVNLDGMGWNPIVSTRGFYGGGEAEYLQVLVDGKKINALETGLVNWNALPMNNFDAVEISRGASSPLYGSSESVRGFREHSHWQGFSVGGDILFLIRQRCNHFSKQVVHLQRHKTDS
jgi:iron complex outermembrane receptor protein